MDKEETKTEAQKEQDEQVAQAQPAQPAQAQAQPAQAQATLAQPTQAQVTATQPGAPKPGIDYEKLKSIGVPDDVIASLDPRDGGNITPQGEVLFLDEERLKRRELPDKPLHKNHPKGLGIKDFLMTKVLATTPKTWDRTLKVFMMIVAGAKLTGKEGIIPELYKRVTQFAPDEEMYTHGNVLPLNVDMVDEGKTAVLPIDLIMDAIDNAEYIAQMNRCICRSAHKCSEYEQTLGCLFFNMAGVTAVKNGLAKPVTKEEAKQHVYEARDAGLIGQALYVELEQMVWGFENQKMDEFMEICFCCPCCCVALDVCKNANRTIKNRFSGSGFTAVIDHDKCTACGKCAQKCPQEIITVNDDGKVTIDQEHCIGCGYCKSVCENGAITLQQTMPLRESIHEYFLKEGRIDMVMDKCTMEIPSPDYEWKDKEMDQTGIVEKAGQKAKEVADDLARNFGCVSAEAFWKYNGKYVAGAAGIGLLACLLLRLRK